MILDDLEPFLSLSISVWLGKVSFCNVRDFLDDLDHFDSEGDMILLEVVPDASQTNDFWERWDRMK